MDYKAVFQKETDTLIELRLMPATNLSEADNLRIIDELAERIKLMEAAIEELRIRRHSIEKARDDHKSQLPAHKQKEVAERDMQDRQKKQQDKLDKQIQIKKAETAALVKTLTLANFTPDEIRAALAKKGLS
jgi:septal ring factor EnvC (AmiA/AmiB activator)